MELGPRITSDRSGRGKPPPRVRPCCHSLPQSRCAGSVRAKVGSSAAWSSARSGEGRCETKPAPPAHARWRLHDLEAVGTLLVRGVDSGLPSLTDARWSPTKPKPWSGGRRDRAGVRQRPEGPTGGHRGDDRGGADQARASRQSLTARAPGRRSAELVARLWPLQASMADADADLTEWTARAAAALGMSFNRGCRLPRGRRRRAQ